MNSSDTKLLTDLEKLQRSLPAVASWQNAQQHSVHGRHAQALAGYKSLVEQYPRVAQLWSELGAAAAAELDFKLADEAFQRAMELAPRDVNLLVSLARQYYRQRNMKQASACFERAVAANPSSAYARLALAQWLEQGRQLNEALACVEASLAQHPNNGHVVHFKALLYHRLGRDDEAEAILRKLINRNPPPVVEVQAKCNHLLAVILDGQGNYAAAWNCLLEAKILVRETVKAAALEAVYDNLDRSRRELLAALKPETIRRWQEQTAAAPAPHPLTLLGGPPRSGTTLVGQILATHPNILLFDEPEAFSQELVNTISSGPAAWGYDFASLDGLSAGKRAEVIGRYFKRLLLESGQAPNNRLLVDKNPSSTASLHIWLRLFPQSKIVTVLRDPRDTIVSCFFQNLPVNVASVNFLNLERTAKFYADSLDVWLRLRDLGGFDWIETRYEEVVSNLEAEGRKITKFLGLPWHERQAAYYEAARGKFVHSPTYSDVTKPIYTKAVKRWENYAGALAPLQGMAEKYSKILGYA